MGIIIVHPHLHDRDDPLQDEVQKFMSQVQQLQRTAKCDICREDYIQMFLHLDSIEIGDNVLSDGGIFLSEEHLF